MLERYYTRSRKIWYVENSINSAIHFISSKDTDEECTMHSKSDNIEITTCEKKAFWFTSF